jgi:hypothetical protein
MSRNKCFFQVQISHVLHSISIYDLFTDSLLGWAGVDWIYLIQEGSYEHGTDYSGSIKCCEILE